MPAYHEDELLPLSALQHLLFCERQCALIHLEQQWRDNRLTVTGRHLHARTDRHPGREQRGDLVVTRSLPLRSLGLGLTGMADVVEFRRVRAGEIAGGFRLPGRKGLWRASVVEYKRGRPKRNRCDEVQVCAQAMCLEEMLQASALDAYIYYGSRRSRSHVALSAELRSLTEQSAARLHDLLSGTRTPLRRPFGGCRSCSLRDSCLPGASSRSSAPREYLERIMDGDGDDTHRGDHEDPL